MSASRTIFTNLGILGGGRVVHALLNLGATACLSRSLDIGDFGTVVLIHVFLLTIRAVVNLRAHLAVVRFGIPLLQADDQNSLARLLVLVADTDRRCAFLSTALAAGLLPLAGMLMDWDRHILVLSALASLILLRSDTAVAMGYLQVQGQIRELNRHVLLGVGTRCVGTLVGLLLALDLYYFVLVWTASIGIEYETLRRAGFRELHRNGLALAGFTALSPAHLHGLTRFTAIAWAQSVLDLIPQRMVTLLVGIDQGSSSGGLFRVASECSTVLSRPAQLLRQTVFPDLVRLIGTDSLEASRAVLHVTTFALAIGGGVTLLSLSFGDVFLSTVFGPAFAPASTLLSWLLGAAAIELAGAALRPAGQALDRSAALLYGQCAGSVALLSLLYPLQSLFGLNGAGMAAAVGACVHVTTMTIIVLMALRAHRPSPLRGS